MGVVRDTDILSRYRVPRHRLTVGDYHRMAEAGIREFWIVDVTNNQVLVHRAPTDGGYGSVTVLDPLGTLTAEALAGVSIQLAAHPL